MAEISRKRMGELVRGVFHLLLPHPDGLPAKPVLERLPAVIPATEFEQSTYPKHPDIRRYEKVLRFSTISAVKAGWLTKNNGLWSLTDEGRHTFTRFPEPGAFAPGANRLYRHRNMACYIPASLANDPAVGRDGRTAELCFPIPPLPACVRLSPHAVTTM